MKMENRYQSRLRRNQVKIVKEIAARVQEVNQDVIREIAREVIQEIVREIVLEMKITDHLISQVIKRQYKARSAKTWPLNSYNCKRVAKYCGSFLFVYNKDDGKKNKISFTVFGIYKGNFIVQNHQSEGITIIQQNTLVKKVLKRASIFIIHSAIIEIEQEKFMKD